MGTMNNHNWYATIQCRILCATDLSANQKLLIALIANLSNNKGYCFASNEYLGKMLNIKKDSVRKLLTDLEQKGYIGRVVKLRADYSVEFRALTIVERTDNPTTFDAIEELDTPQDKNTVPPQINIPQGPGQISPTPPDKSAYIITELNNKVNNKEEHLSIDSNIVLYIPKEGKFTSYKEIEEYMELNNLQFVYPDIKAKNIFNLAFQKDTLEGQFKRIKNNTVKLTPTEK